jgi:hypothetical protein
MKSTQRLQKWILLALAGMVVLPVVALVLGILLVTPIRSERSPVLESTIAAPSEGEPVIVPPVSAQISPLLSLDPQNPVHIFVVMPLIAALVVLPITGVTGIVWWVWLRPKNDSTEAYENGEGEEKSTRVRHALFGILLWVALSMLFIFDLLGAASLYPLFIAIYVVFCTLVGALLLYDRHLGEKAAILVLFLALVFSIRFVDWNSRKPFLRDFYRVEEGMTYQQVEQIMGSYTGSAGLSAEIDEQGHVVEGSVSYTHTDEGWGDSDIGLVTFQDGVVAETEFLPD